MTLRYHSLACLLISIFGLLILREQFNKIEVSQTDIIKKLSSSDTESRFAAGLKINLSTLERFDLELIPGISNKSCEEILVRKSEIILKSISLSKEHKHEAFEIVSGIGPQKAKLLLQYLELK